MRSKWQFQLRGLFCLSAVIAVAVWPAADMANHPPPRWSWGILQRLYGVRLRGGVHVPGFAI
jgi:hypothetical protein